MCTELHIATCRHYADTPTVARASARDRLNPAHGSMMVARGQPRF